jgi:hypothetical protein
MKLSTEVCLHFAGMKLEDIQQIFPDFDVSLTFVHRTDRTKNFGILSHFEEAVSPQSAIKDQQSALPA